MGQLLEVKVLLVLVIISLFFPLKIIFSHYQIGMTEKNSPEVVAKRGKSGETEMFPKDYAGVIAAKRVEAINQAKRQGKDEYSYSIKVPPPPVSGGN